MSPVAKKFGMFNDREFMNGLQARVKGKFAKDVFVVYLGEKYFGWSVPENEDYSRVGVVTRENPREFFEDVMKRVGGEFVEYQSGLIPLYQQKLSCQKGNVFLLGDAATQCKGSTHGGIIQGMIASCALKDAFLNGGNYDRLLKKKLGRDLYIHLKIRNKMDFMSEEKLNLIIKLVKREKIKKILEDYDRDFASKIVFKVLINELRFLRLVIS